GEGLRAGVLDGRGAYSRCHDAADGKAAGPSM
ncbi:MAG: hypothetical protein AVDCRST_MAG28-1965, partial [uncultured Rubrobacteraceae bacterium]